jgi:multidrug efflux pump subunit AcrA (membrane-fusion protein)
MKRVWIILGSLLAAAVIGTAGYLGFRSSQPQAEQTPQAPETVKVAVCDVTQTVTAPGNAVNARELLMRLPFSAKVTGVPVRPGNLVQAGDPLVELDPADVALAVAQAQVDLASARAALQAANRYRSNLDYPRASDLTRAQAEARYASAQQLLANAQAAYDATSGLGEADPARLAALDALAAARHERDQALANLNWFTGKPSSQEISAAEATLALAQARLEQAQEALAQLEQMFITEAGITASLKSPSSGVVLDVLVQPGETAGAGVVLIKLADPLQVEVRVTVLEEDYPFVQVGQRVELYFDALPDAQALGTVDRILPLRAPGDRPLYYVYIRLDEVPAHLVDGMTADASIVIAERSQVLCLPRALVRAASGPTAGVTVWNGQTTETRQIQVGLRGDVYIEILSGLEAGEQVVTR